LQGFRCASGTGVIGADLRLGWVASVEVFVPADMFKAPFLVGVRDDRTFALL
jgi:hypothetical protein